MVIETNDAPLRERLAICDGCGCGLPLRGAGLVEDGAVLCPTCAQLDVQADAEPPALA
jgi:uncharacterized Zn finger protein (UPF0148 family)